jgi:hypothetical protein
VDGGWESVSMVGGVKLIKVVMVVLMELREMKFRDKNW